MTSSRLSCSSGKSRRLTSGSSHWSPKMSSPRKGKKLLCYEVRQSCSGVGRMLGFGRITMFENLGGQWNLAKPSQIISMWDNQVWKSMIDCGLIGWLCISCDKNQLQAFLGTTGIQCKSSLETIIKHMPQKFDKNSDTFCLIILFYFISTASSTVYFSNPKRNSEPRSPPIQEYRSQFPNFKAPAQPRSSASKLDSSFTNRCWHFISLFVVLIILFACQARRIRSSV